MVSCSNCLYFRIENEIEYSLFCCILLDDSGAYSQVLGDIGWNNYKKTVSKFCPILKEVKKKGEKNE